MAEPEQEGARAEPLHIVEDWVEAWCAGVDAFIADKADEPEVRLGAEEIAKLGEEVLACRSRMPLLCETVDTRPCLLGTPQLMQHILASDELFAQQFASARGVEEEEEATREDSHFGAGAQGTHQFATLDVPYGEDDEYEARLEAMQQVHAAMVHDS